MSNVAKYISCSIIGPKKKTKATATTTTTTTTAAATTVETAAATTVETNVVTETVVTKKPAAAKKGSTVKIPIREGSFTNTTMPDPLVLPKTPEGCVKISSWNVSGLNASLKKVKLKA